MVHDDAALRKVGQTWNMKLAVREDVNDVSRLFKSIYICTDITKFRDFQFRLLHNKIFCNDILFHWRKVNSNICNFCEVHKQMILHLLYNCSAIRPIWDRLHTELKKAKIVFSITEEMVIFNRGHAVSNHIVNFIMLITKQYFYRCKI